MQGSAADVLKIAMLHLTARLPPSARIVLQIHDELLLEVPTGVLADVAGLVREVMTTTTPLRVPLAVSLSVGARWADMAPMAMGEGVNP